MGRRSAPDSFALSVGVEGEGRGEGARMAESMKDIRAAGIGACSTTAELLEAFEEAWQRGAPLRIDDVMASPAGRASTNRRRLLEELVATDLEYRWRRSASGARQPPVERWTLE